MNAVESHLLHLRDQKRAKNSARYFKTGKGEYGEGDRFLGIRVPEVRRVVKSCSAEATLSDAVELLQSWWHEVRLAGCLLMVELRKQAVKNADLKEQERIYKIYLKNTHRINNWDLVDVSARDIVGEYLYGKNALALTVLTKLAHSKSLWERRIAVVATSAWIRQKDSAATFALCTILLKDSHDLIHKACGWMLREVGKSCGIATLNTFLDDHAHEMPRTMVRYSLEKHTMEGRRKYLKKF